MAKSRKQQDTTASTSSPFQRTAGATLDLPDTAPDRSDTRRDRIGDDRRGRIARRAYELYLERGGSHGSDWEDWLRAEREVLDSGRDERPE